MASKKTERLLNLVICLLHAREPVTAEYIYENVYGYANDQTPATFNRMFERDKAELREMGIPLLTGPAPSGVGVEGYRIDRASYELPDIHLDADEAAAVAAAAVVWDSADVSALTQSALLKLKAAGIDARVDDAVEITPRQVSSEPVIAALVDASTQRQVVTFTHTASGATATTHRTVEPWGVVTCRGAWYLVGWDRTRDERRTYRLSRVTDVALSGKPGAFEIPADVDLAAVANAAVTSASARDAGLQARIWVAKDRGAGLRRMATATTEHEMNGAPGDVVAVEAAMTMDSLVRAVLSTAADAVVLEPEELRSRVIAGLDALIGTGS